MNIGSVTTKRFNKEELIKAINDTFKDCDEFDTVAVITEVAEYKGDKAQTIIFSKNIDFWGSKV